METKQPKRATEAAADTVASMPAMYVKRGRTVQLDGVSSGPVDHLSPADYVHLLATGFISAECPVLEPSAAEASSRNPAHIGLQDAHQKFVQGPTYAR